jgi:uncharacterized protein (TIGR02186 family)
MINKISNIFFLFSFFFVTLFLAQKVNARPIISGISANEINIDTKFTGAEILLFGAKGDAGNIIVTIRGPRKNYLLNKKDKFLGVWYNKERLKFKDAYSYYAFFSTNNKQRLDSRIISQLEIGKNNIEFNVSGDESLLLKDKFKIEFIDKLEKKLLYLDNPEPIEFLDETLFKVMLQFPKNISRGVYIVEIYLLDENNLVAFQSIPIYVNQVGLSAGINQFAYNNAVLYGICAVLLAVLAGWLANFIFTKFFGK